MTLPASTARCDGYNTHAALPFPAVCDRRQHCARYVQAIYRDPPNARVPIRRFAHDPAKDCRAFIAEVPKLSR